MYDDYVASRFCPATRYTITKTERRDSIDGALEVDLSSQAFLRGGGLRLLLPGIDDRLDILRGGSHEQERTSLLMLP
jgi:hypothetical protein